MRAPLPLLLSLLATACGSEPPTQAEVDEARGHVERTLAVAERGREALQLLGLLPDYTCGESERSFLGRAAEGLRAEAACLSAEVVAEPYGTDVLRVRFADGGCALQGHQLTGLLSFSVGTGTDRVTVDADLTHLQVDGTPLDAMLRYGTCGDETSYYVSTMGDVPRSPEYSYSVQAYVTERDGIMLIGSDQLVLYGHMNVHGPQGEDFVQFDGLDYVVGNLLPREGSVKVQTEDGHLVRATFRTTLWRLGEAELTVDDHEPVTVPVLH